MSAFQDFSISAFAPQGRQFFAVAKNEPRQPERAQIARGEDARLAKQSQQPSEIKAIGPHWDRRLIAGEKGERGADAMNRRTRAQIFFQKQTEFFLNPATNP